MAKIPLRVYLNEVETLIEQAQIEEAVAHCRHILQTLPKNLATYRLLGKAFMEGRRYSDAADIFRRILSTQPDDFTAQIGMSMIREDEKNYDAAIWHMERAFEVQPYNSAIQNELRRLYGLRDRVEPPKVRLTRGALARMYARGDLYQQAIGELRAGLAEDPERHDLLVMLARMYFLAGMKVEAVEICSTLLKKLPYCLECNRIIASILPETERRGEAQAYQQRVAAIDPYLAQASPRHVNGDAVPDNTVTLDSLSYQPGQAKGAEGQPDWAASLGVAFQPETSEAALPDWLSGTGFEAETDAEEISDNWDESPAEARFSWEDAADEETADTADAVQETPDWMTSPEEEDESQPAGVALPDWMKEAGWDVSEGAEEVPPPPLDFYEEDSTGSTEPASGEIPDWLRAMAPPGALEESLEDDSSADDLLPWLEEANAQKQEAQMQEDLLAGEASEPVDIIQPEQASEEVPDWLQGLSDEASPDQEDYGRLDTEETPDWLKDLGQPAGQAAEEMDFGSPEPDLRNQAAAETDAAELDPAAVSADEQAGLFEGISLQDEDAAMAWLENLAARQGASEEEFLTKPEDRREAMPEWLNEDVQEESGAEAAWAADASPAEAVTGETAPAPVEAEAAGGPSEPEPDSEALVDDAVWAPSEPKPAEESAAWLADLKAEQGAQFAAPTLEEDGAPVEAGLFEGMSLADEDATMAWLESLAAKQGASEEEFISKPDDREDSLPDWLLEDLETGAAEETLVAPVEGETAVSEWAVEKAETELPETAAAEPDWLAELEAESSLSDEGELTSAEAAVRGEIPDWLSRLEADQEPEAEAQAAPVEQAAAPAQGLFEGVSLADEDATMAWLESLAAKQGASEEELISKPEDRSAALPEWLVEAQPEEAAPDAAADAADFEDQPVPLEPSPEETVVEEALYIPVVPDLYDEIESELPNSLLSEEPEQPGETQEIYIPQVPDLKDEHPMVVEMQETQDQQAAEMKEEAPAGTSLFEGMSLEDEDATMAWLESLAARQGASEEEFISRPETRQDVMPEWVAGQASLDEEKAAPAISAEEDLEDTKPIHLRPIEEAPAVEIKAPPVFEAQAEEAAAEEVYQDIVLQAAPELEDVSGEAFAGDEIVLEEVVEEAPVTEELEEPAWLPEPAEAEAEPAQAEPELPDWLAGAEEPKAAAAAQDEPALPDWLVEESEAGSESEGYDWLPPDLAESVQAVPQPALPQLDLNTASLVELEKLPGIGFRLAQSIVDYRIRNGPFQQEQDLLKVPGMEANLFEELRSSFKAITPAVEPQAPSQYAPTPPAEAGSERNALSKAREAMLKGSLDESLQHYLSLIQEERLLDEVVRDLQDALFRHPVEINLWQALGDAYVRNNQLQEALEAYIRAEEILR